MALNESETLELVRLLGKLEWPVGKKVFHALMRCVVSVPLELVVFGEGGHVLLIDRKDEEFNGWHMPGTVMRDSDSVSSALERLLQNELGGQEVLGDQEYGDRRAVHGLQDLWQPVVSARDPPV